MDMTYLALCTVVVLVVMFKSPSSSIGSVGVALGSATLVALFAFAIGFAFDGSTPLDIILLRRSADIYSVFLVSVSFGLVARAMVLMATRYRTRRPQQDQD